MGSHTAMPGSARPTWGLGWRASPWAQGGQRHAATSTLACARSFTPPTVKLFHSSCNPLGDTHTTIQLLCLVSGYVPGDMEVIWLVDGQKATNMFSYTAPGTQEGNVTSTHSELNITQGEWVSQKTYTCQVVYQGLTFNANARKCTGTAPHPHRLPHTRAQRGATARPHAAPPTHAESDPRGVSSYLTPPSPLDLYVHKSPKITCLVVDLASTEGMSLTWSRESGEPVHPGKPEERAQFNGTISVTSTLPVDTEDWIEGETYHCTVTHPDLPKDLVRSIAKAPGEPQPQGRGWASRAGAWADPTPVPRQACRPGGLRVPAPGGGRGDQGQGHPHVPDPELLPCGHFGTMASERQPPSDRPARHHVAPQGPGLQARLLRVQPPGGQPGGLGRAERFHLPSGARGAVRL